MDKNGITSSSIINSSDFEIVQKHLMQLCSSLKATPEICNNQLQINEKLIPMDLTTTESIDASNSTETNKFINGYNFCTIEAKKFLISNGINDDEILEKIIHQHHQHQQEQKRQQQQQKQQKTLKKISGNYNLRKSKLKNYNKKENILSEKNITENLKLNQNKKEILQRIRTKIFERRQVKMMSDKRKLNNVWRPW